MSAAVELLGDARDELALLLAWKIGKPWRLACADADRCWAGQQHRVLELPMSVLVHSELVELLAGNAVIATTPTRRGAATLTLAHASMARTGLPVTLLSGTGAELSGPLVRHDSIGALAFVGGRANGRAVATALVDTGRRHMLGQGLNSWGIWGIWDFSDWDALAAHLRKGFEYGKQRCTADPRYVVQRGRDHARLPRSSGSP